MHRSIRSLMRCVAAGLMITLGSASSFAASDTMKNLREHRSNIASSEALPPAVSSHDPRPTPPSPVAGHRPTVVKQAGVGGPVAYARSGVLELGGGLSFAQATKSTQLAVTPSVGWFLADNFELSLLANVNYAKTEGNLRNMHVIGMLEPSVHIPLMDNLFVFGGWGLGAAYEKQNGTTGFAMAPRLGLDIGVGRSGIIRPSASMNWATNGTSEVKDKGTAVVLNASYNMNLTYSVMW